MKNTVKFKLDKYRTTAFNDAMVETKILEIELDSITQVLKYGDEHGLSVEIIWSAMNAIKDNPKLAISEALNIGAGEWIK
jgi:hypothetical protein